MTGTILLIKLIAIILGLVIRWTIRRTVNSLPALAERRGWRYRPHSDDLPKADQGEPFGIGYNRRVQNVLTGTHRGRTFSALEYAFETGTGRKHDLHVYSVVTVTTPAECPMLDVSREGPGPGAPTHELEMEHEGFNKKFVVRTEDDRFAFDVLHRTTMDWMLGDERGRTFPIRFHGNTLVAWESGMLDIGRMLAMLDYLCDHLDRIPEPAWAQGVSDTP